MPFLYLMEKMSLPEIDWKLPSDWKQGSLQIFQASELFRIPTIANTTTAAGTVTITVITALTIIIIFVVTRTTKSVFAWVNIHC